MTGILTPSRASTAALPPGLLRGNLSLPLGHGAQAATGTRIMLAQRRVGQDVIATTALVHCTETDQCQEAVVSSVTDKTLIVYFERADFRLVLQRKDTRRPYVGQRGKLEFTVLDADIEWTQN